jgi:hypothetical protein|tara:strand:+ start:85 stop:564 length:480 start_codon:yes stop_codon:yes gene_type:complete
MEQEFESMSKAQLESHGRTVGIELDRRLVKSQLVAQLQEFITLKKIEEEMDVEDTDLDFIAQVLEEGLPHGGPDNDPVIQASIEVPTMQVDVFVDDVDPAIIEQEHKDKIRMLQNMHEDVIQAEARTIASGIALAEEKIEHDALSARSIRLREEYEQSK